MEGSRASFALLELFGPAALEVDRVDHEHDILWINAVDDLRDAAARARRYPRVDGVLGGRHAEVQLFSLRIEGLLHRGEKSRLKRGPFARPGGVCDADVYALVEAEEQ